MLFINPQIDGSNGFAVIKLQLAFSKDIAIDIIDGWGTAGITHFKQWLFVDYIYVASYSIFFALSYCYFKVGLRACCSGVCCCIIDY